ncbi:MULTISPECIES: phytanoyl-CoA dioxygenase family protein [unclassified Streptomyces]|uniref:phytanoyl-CoA dioxygenase family protein n=1 Tax=unclassified Streptomyces TaxID=2593676 RepID=UPI002DDC3320|nr:MULTISPECIES: phytanoyl-CoA dioxygenase family protein [unclassified Streptomyces]WSA91026.1 phytanoyl-CoA dioxygenase family protein [Streptomyces sp. NBC_01795]WSB75350.1 phytanoyl-CoA dioxygenase family protein [Streptomyces sp. NBC_01775]WSS16367.1 phytanoyl-CoA dioxygenase family protein [Streptomyces sp. NBC_01186]WSS45185.1 phytanoyl-CoA dioxygenase family protein [Streptomyces sp. NBC_01187]
MTAAEPVEDLYPTRSVRESVPFRRRHPVVWGTEADGPLSAGELAAFDRDGFLSFEALLGAEEILGCLEETERLGRDAGLRASGRVAPGPDADGIRSVFEVHALSEVFARVIRSSPLADVARQLLGSEVYVHQSGVSLKSAFNGSMCGWHADFETWHSEDGMAVPRALSFSVALTDNQPVNGPLMIIPGSHRTFVPAVGETPPADRTVVTELALRNGIQQLTASAGSAVLFDCNCLHASAGNVSPFRRTNLFVVYNSVDNALGPPFAAPAPRPGFLADRRFTPVPR